MLGARSIVKQWGLSLACVEPRFNPSTEKTSLKVSGKFRLALVLDRIVSSFLE